MCKTIHEVRKMKRLIEILRNPMPGDRCLLCGRRPYCVGIFTPENSQLWGAAAGKALLLRYCLCRKCQRKGDTPGRIEKVLWSEVVGGITHA